MSRSTILTVIALLSLVGFLAWSTMSSQTVECRACVQFAGGRNCATASAASEEEAVRSAQITACGPLTNGMNESIACGNRPVVERSCSPK